MTGSLAETPLAVVLASIDAPTALRASLERWLIELDGQGELIVVDASRDGTADEVARGFPGVRLLRRPPGRLAPELWRDGLDATDAPLVAFSTTQMVPVAGWRIAMLGRLEETGAAVVGGPIEPPGVNRPLDRAIYLLRFIHYIRPLIDPGRIEPPGDNAVYRRDRLVELELLWRGGFWEVEVHRALRARGERLVMAEGAAVTFEGVRRFPPLIRQRYAHARRYGASRARILGTSARLARIAAAPVVPAVLLGRMTAALSARGRSLAPWLPALPFLFPLLAAWTLGEVRGLAEVPSDPCRVGLQPASSSGEMAG